MNTESSQSKHATKTEEYQMHFQVQKNNLNLKDAANEYQTVDLQNEMNFGSLAGIKKEVVIAINSKQSFGLSGQFGGGTNNTTERQGISSTSAHYAL